MAEHGYRDASGPYIVTGIASELDDTVYWSIEEVPVHPGSMSTT